MKVIVLGLGAMGSAAAQHLAERGCRVQGFDRFAPPHAFGSSHGLTRIFRQAYFEDHRYVPLLMRAFELWKRLERDTGENLLHLPGALVLGPLDGALVERSQQSAREFGLPHEMLNASEIRRRYPVFDVTPDTHALLEQNAGYLRAEKCVEQQLRQAARASAELHLNEPVLNWHASENDLSVTVKTELGTYTADRLVITAGPWAPQVLADLGIPMRTTRQVLYWFQPRGSIDLFRQEHLPVYLMEARDPELLLYGFPLTGPEEEGVKVALHGSDEAATPDNIRRSVGVDEESAIRDRLSRIVPRLAGRLLRAETCLYTMTPDEHFVVGAHPRHAAVTIASGFSGHGFKFAAAIGEVITDLVLQGHSAFDLDLFSLARF